MSALRACERRKLLHPCQRESLFACISPRWNDRNVMSNNVTCLTWTYPPPFPLFPHCFLRWIIIYRCNTKKRQKKILHITAISLSKILVVRTSSLTLIYCSDSYSAKIPESANVVPSANPCSFYERCARCVSNKIEATLHAGKCAWKDVRVYVALDSRYITSNTFFLWAFYTDELVFSWWTINWKKKKKIRWLSDDKWRWSLP